MLQMKIYLERPRSRCSVQTFKMATGWSLLIQIFKMATVWSLLIQIFKMAAVCSKFNQNIQNGGCVLTINFKYSKWRLFAHHSKQIFKMVHVCSPFNTNIQNGGCTQSECTYNGYLLLGARTLLFYIDILHPLTQIFTRGYTLYVDIR